MHRTRNAAYGQPYRGFESLPLRQLLGPDFRHKARLIRPFRACRRLNRGRHALPVPADVPPEVPVNVPGAPANSPVAKSRHRAASGVKSPPYLIGGPAGWRFQIRLPANLVGDDFRLAEWAVAFASPWARATAARLGVWRNTAPRSAGPSSRSPQQRRKTAPWIPNLTATTTTNSPNRSSPRVPRVSTQCSLWLIARRLGRSASTISREVSRNGGAARYRSARSDQAAWDRALRPKLCKLACRPFLSWTVSIKLRRQWSPEQIAGWLKRTYPGEPQKQVSHETIYRSLFIQARGVLKKELLEHLRAKRTIRRSRHASMKRNGLGQIKNAVSIRESPASVEDRAVPGHWEGDLTGGSKNSYVATLVERHSRYVMLVKVANKDTESVVSALIKQSQRLPSELYRSLTRDRGKELADLQRLALATEIEVHFCDPRSPWQRGSNETTNRLLRQYLPRGTDLSLHSQAKLSAIARQFNERPRKTLLHQTPAEKFANVLQRLVEPAT